MMNSDWLKTTHNLKVHSLMVLHFTDEYLLFCHFWWDWLQFFFLKRRQPDFDDDGDEDAGVCEKFKGIVIHLFSPFWNFLWKVNRRRRRRRLPGNWHFKKAFAKLTLNSRFFQYLASYGYTNLCSCVTSSNDVLTLKTLTIHKLVLNIFPLNQYPLRFKYNLEATS